MVDILDERKLLKGPKKGFDSDIANTCITLSLLIALLFFKRQMHLCMYLIVNSYGTANLHYKLISLLKIVISSTVVCFHCVKYDHSLIHISPYKDRIVILSSHSPGASGERKPYHFSKVLHKVFLLHLFSLSRLTIK